MLPSEQNALLPEEEELDEELEDEVHLKNTLEQTGPLPLLLQHVDIPLVQLGVSEGTRQVGVPPLGHKTQAGEPEEELLDELDEEVVGEELEGEPLVQTNKSFLQTAEFLMQQLGVPLLHLLSRATEGIAHAGVALFGQVIFLSLPVQVGVVLFPGDVDSVRIKTVILLALAKTRSLILSELIFPTAKSITS